jgi:serine/threonine protein kinase/tetratricopeptide (TPR) repeat protein
MSEAQVCRRCARELAAETARGLCPDCLVNGSTHPGTSNGRADATGFELTPVGGGEGFEACPSDSETTIEYMPDPPGVPEGPGSRIGPYKLLQKIGEGGMGAVYLAVQETPVQRRVAIKIIKPGLDTEQFTARFDAERQTLALMDHPNIAKVLDAGATDTGLPYFVMELVRGISITAYCDQARLGVRQRLELLIPVCHAIQHAHQKGIIHRDIKPSNVLVTFADDKPVAKVIDFGVAKTIDQKLTEATLFTHFGAVIGTLEYMSPEQAETRGLDIDTRSDIYSLGILLYELLTGSTPVACRRFRHLAFGDLIRRVREEEPPKPSVRLSSAEDPATIAANRSIEPGRLTLLVRGELDWIVMKALEKDRTRRYETANGLARDIQRYLAGDPVEAGPPSVTYRLRKLARKYQALLLSAAAFLGLLMVAAVVSTSLALRALRAEAEARQRLIEVQHAVAGMNRALEDTRSAQATTTLALKQSEADRSRAEAESHQTESVNKFLIDIFRSPELSAQGQEVKVADLLDRAFQNLDTRFVGGANVRGDLYNALGETYYGLRLYARAVAAHERARDVRLGLLGTNHPATLASMNKLALAYANDGRTAEAIKLHEETLKLRRRALGPEHADTLGSMINLANAYRSAGRLKEAIALHEEALKQVRARLGNDHSSTLAGMSNLALDYQAAGRYSEAVSLLKETLELRESKLGHDHLETVATMMSLGQAYRSADRLTEAIPVFEEALEIRRAKLGPDHSDTFKSLINLAQTLENSSRLGEAEALWNEMLTHQRRKLPPGDIALAETLSWLGTNLRRQDRSADAEPIFRECLAIREKQAPDDWATFNTQSQLGGTLISLQKYAEAEPLLISGYNGLVAREARITVKSRDRMIAAAGQRIVQLYNASGQPEKARQWRKLLASSASGAKSTH